MLEELGQLPEGKMVINLYEYDLKDDLIKKKDIRITSKVRTVIDLFCENRSNAAEQLIEDLW